MSADESIGCGGSAPHVMPADITMDHATMADVIMVADVVIAADDIFMFVRIIRRMRFCSLLIR